VKPRERYQECRDDLFFTATNTLLNQDQKAVHIHSALLKLVVGLNCLDLLELQMELLAAGRMADGS
jgi:hypothetical protein